MITVIVITICVKGTDNACYYGVIFIDYWFKYVAGMGQVIHVYNKEERSKE